MPKLKLDLDRLTVDSFPTCEVMDGIGTIHAREGVATLKVVCTVSTLATNPTCCPCTP
jgi:hypothetical protein